MKKRLLCGLFTCAALACAQETTFENEQLAVTVTPQPLRYSVLDKRTGQRWEQPQNVTLMSAEKLLIRRTPTAVAIPPAKDGTLSAKATVQWTDGGLLLTATVADSTYTTVGAGDNWWNRDSVEFWINSRQYAVYTEDGGAVRVVKGNGKETLKLSQATITHDNETWTVRATLDYGELGLEGKEGTACRFALGVNDCDVPAANRRAQIYYPATWRHSTPATFARAVLAGDGAAAGKLPPEAPPVSDFRREGNGVAYTWRQPDRPAVTVKAELMPQSASLRFTLTPLDGNVRLDESYPELPGFLLTAPDGVLTLVDGSSGHLYPLDHDIFPGSYGLAGDMTFICMTELKSGRGYGLYGLTPDDGTIAFETLTVNGRRLRVPRMRWNATMGKFGAAARVSEYTFVDRGGYVALAKHWRKWAAAGGHLVTLREKAQHNPNVYKLMGAADLWDGHGIGKALKARSYGIRKLLFNGPISAEEMARMVDLGYLLGRYDIYTDVYNDKPEAQIDAFSAPIPGHIVRNADGSKRSAWTTFDGSRTSWKRCTAVMLDAARRCIPPDLQARPYNARFLDVTTSEGLYECYHPDHPMTRTDKRKHSEDVIRYFGNWEDGNLNLVSGGEHGKWWCAKALHYVEGMQSGGHANYSWPAGYRRRPKTKDDDARGKGNKTDKFVKRYEIYGVGPRYRVPLWDLCLHDCITTTWYWGDTNDFLIEAAPEVTPRKDAFNILQASMPTYCINNLGTWQQDFSSFLRSYFHCTKVHEKVGMEEMLTHEFLNDERTVHKTTFSGGYEIIVNMDTVPQTVTLKGKTYNLAPNGFAVDGPGLQQEMVMRDGLYCSQVRTPGFYFASKAVDALPRMDGTSGAKSILIADTEAPQERRVAILGDNSLAVPAELFQGWAWDTTLVFAINDLNERESLVDDWTRDGDTIRLPRAGRYVIICGKAADAPDYSLTEAACKAADSTLTVTVCNRAYGSAEAVVRCHVGSALPANLLGEQAIGKLAHGQKKTLSFRYDPAEFVGRHSFMFTVEAAGDLVAVNNEARVVQEFPLQMRQFPLVRSLTLPPRAVDSELEPYEGDIDLAQPTAPPFKLNPASVCVTQILADGSSVLLPYAFFMPSKDFDGTGNCRGRLYFSYQATAGQESRFQILLTPRKLHAGSDSCLFTLGTAPGSGKFVTPDYVAEFSAGTIAKLSPGSRYAKDAPSFLKNLIVSSAATGWASEDKAVLKRFDVVMNTPAKCVVVASNTLKNGATYIKTYTFYPGRFLVDVELDKGSGGQYSRAFYAIPGIYMDDKGHTVEMAKTTDGANIAGKNPQPRWYAVRGKGWAHSCIALSPFDNISYWDSTGQIGFSTGRIRDLHYAYFVYGEQPDFSFAEHDYARMTK